MSKRKMKQFDLKKLSKEHPFKVPEGYFDVLHDRINAENFISSENPNSSAFNVPENYFEGLNQRILAEVKNDKRDQFPSNTRNKLWFGTAAAVSAVLLSVAVLFFNSDSGLDANVLADISNDEILLYLEYYEVDELDLLESIDDDMVWVNDENQLLEEMDLEDTSLDELYLEYGLGEFM